jgi:hypothetical protein
MSVAFSLVAKGRAGALESAFDEVTVEDFETMMLLWEWLRVYAACAAHDCELLRTGCLDSGLL